MAFLGTLSSVLTINASMRACPIVRGAPERGASPSPSIRCSMNRRRHLPTVSCRSRAGWRPPGSLRLAPKPRRSARNARACPVSRRDVSDLSSVRSVSSNSTQANAYRPLQTLPKTKECPTTESTSSPANFRLGTLEPRPPSLIVLCSSSEGGH
jgi:hypothetical protein